MVGWRLIPEERAAWVRWDCKSVTKNVFHRFQVCLLAGREMVAEREATHHGGSRCHCNRHSTCFLMRYEIQPLGHSPVIEQWVCRVCATVTILQSYNFVLDHAQYFPELG
jgi:hypothetical protein